DHLDFVPGVHFFYHAGRERLSVVVHMTVRVDGAAPAHASRRDAFLDKEVSAIIAVIGGFNSNQLLNSIDWEKIDSEKIDKIREEQKFNGIEALANQLMKDKITALKILADN
ncbi:MAG: hypothetical protein EOM73_01250, partial [Bacteroidia bacterium]|nr:hypothetical protein [Bacteroidia bacterium]